MMKEAWSDLFTKLTKDVPSDIPYQESAEDLRQLIKSKTLLFTDMRDDPSKFFEAHRLLLAPHTRGPGFGIRFTVQFNLFAGSILGLGNEDQVKLLDKYQSEGTLGCFCLTERFAGVNSGLVVGTTCTWLPENQMFLLNCPDEGSEKNWISQGLTATKAVVIANLIVKDRSYGPHAFIVDLEGNKSKIDFTDMGRKTTGNDLDNARIRFKNVLIPKDSLLSRFAEIRNDEYFQPTKQKMRLEVIGQRLLTGRLAISQAALIFTKKLFAKTKKFAQTRQVWSPKKKEYLAELPQLATIFEEGDVMFDRLTKYTDAVEKEISLVLRNSEIPSNDLVERIAVGKIACVENCIKLGFKLKQEVGSYGLMDGTGFEHLDFLQCCKFAEGDSRILSQKLARDTMKKFRKDSNALKSNEVKTSCSELTKGMMETGEQDFIKNWNLNWQKVYGVAAAVQKMHIDQAVAGASKL